MKLSRRAVGVAAAGTLVSTAGCVGFVTGSDSLRFEADPAEPSEETLSATEYDERRIETRTITESFTVAGVTREVDARNVLAEYERALDAGPLGRARTASFSAFSTPQVDLLWRTFNPIAELDNREVAEQVASGYDDVSIGEEVDRTTLSVLGDEVEVSTYTAEAYVGSELTEVHLHLGTAEATEDFVVVVGIYPRLVDDSEEVYHLAESLSQ
ncbi:DUF6517 family protein [Natronorarus salvus]|uniref:DUF6517 family protein n=1 Tax=Natronorarus salvus TaxID=3117733 RepID=UPI002F261664